MDNLLGWGAAAPSGKKPGTTEILHSVQVALKCGRPSNLSHVQVANTPRAQRVLSCSGIGALAPTMTPIADEGTSARPTPADTPRLVPGTPSWEQPVADAAVVDAGPNIAADALGFRAMLSSTEQRGTSSTNCAREEAELVGRATAADAAGADVNLPPSPGGSAASGAMCKNLLAAAEGSSSSSSSSSSGEDTSSLPHTPAVVLPTQQQAASVPPAAHGAASAASTYPAATVSTCPKPSHRRPVRRVLTFTENDARSAPFLRLEPDLLAAPTPSLPEAWANNPLATAASQEVALDAVAAAPSVSMSAASLAASARQSVQAAHAVLPSAWQVPLPLQRCYRMYTSSSVGALQVRAAMIEH